MRIVYQNQAVALYNTRDKEPVGFFKNASVAARYLFILYDINKSARINHAARHKEKITKGTRFEFPVAVRKCTPAQNEVLDRAEAVIFQGYPEIVYNSIGSGFVVTEK